MPQAEKKYVLKLENFTHVLSDKTRKDVFTVYIKEDLPLLLERGKFISILGESGCGKTTLLTLIGLLRAPSRQKEDAIFKMWIQGEEDSDKDILKLWKKRKRKELERLRRKYIGFALQEGELLLSHTVRQNIAVPLALNGKTSKEDEKRVDELIKAFGLNKPDKDLTNSMVQNLSGGEKQRVVLARAIVHSPELVFIDEPTAALNRGLAEQALQNLKRYQSESTIVMITHDEQLAKDFSDIIIRMEPNGHSGFVKSIEPNIPRKCRNIETDNNPIVDNMNTVAGNVGMNSGNGNWDSNIFAGPGWNISGTTD